MDKKNSSGGNRECKNLVHPGVELLNPIYWSFVQHKAVYLVISYQAENSTSDTSEDLQVNCPIKSVDIYP